MVFKRHLRKNNAALKSIEEGDSFNDGFKIEFCDGINVLIGENGVGKTTILKMIYAATQWSRILLMANGISRVSGKEAFTIISICVPSNGILYF